MQPEIDLLPELSRTMESWTPQEILRWAWDTYGTKLTMATAFGAEGCAIVSMLAGIAPGMYIFNLDTGYQFPETLETRDRLMEKYGITIDLVRPEQSVNAMESQFGGAIYGTDPDRCCHIRKVVPLTSTLRDYDAWITAIRRDQSPTRRNAPIVGWDKKFGLAKVNPLATWTKTDLWTYILDNDVPYNPLHDRGYPSIGCWPCTRAVQAAENERDGRWSGSIKTECGLHVPDYSI
ncbi:MAG: phosphoadenylyl-sulfate reductase [Capsulimonadaceae bacterium]